MPNSKYVDAEGWDSLNTKKLTIRNAGACDNGFLAACGNSLFTQNHSINHKIFMNRSLPHTVTDYPVPRVL